MTDVHVQIIRELTHSIVIVRAGSGGTVAMMKRDVQRDDPRVARLIKRTLKRSAKHERSR